MKQFEKIETSEDNVNEENAVETTEDNQRLREIVRGDYTIRIKERKPQENELDHTWLPDQRVCNIDFITKTGEVISLNSFLPEGWRMVQEDNTMSRMLLYSVSKELRASQGRKTVYFPRNYLFPRWKEDKNPPIGEGNKESKSDSVGFLQRLLFESHDFLKMDGALIGLLHEIGHTYEPEKSDDEQIKQSFYRGLAGMAKSDILDAPQEAMLDYLDTVMKSERFGWAKGLDIYRDLLKKGIDLEPNLTLKEIMELIEHALTTYMPTATPEILERRRREHIAEMAVAERRGIPAHPDVSSE